MEMVETIIPLQDTLRMDAGSDLRTETAKQIALHTTYEQRKLWKTDKNLQVHVCAWFNSDHLFNVGGKILFETAHRVGAYGKVCVPVCDRGQESLRDECICRFTECPNIWRHSEFTEL